MRIHTVHSADVLHRRSSHSSSSPNSLTTPPQTIASSATSISPSLASHLVTATVDFAASREAFLAVLASECDPHLNTIHAVCEKFSQGRGHLPPSVHSLNPPRPPNRPLNIWRSFVGTDGAYVLRPQLGDPVDPIGLGIDFDSLNAPDAFIPSHQLAGPLSVPFLEPPHPTAPFELDAAAVWALVLTSIDLTRTDIQALASVIAGKVRCYGYGPVLLRSEVDEICRGLYPSTALAIADGAQVFRKSSSAVCIELSANSSRTSGCVCNTTPDVRLRLQRGQRDSPMALPTKPLINPRTVRQFDTTPGDCHAAEEASPYPNRNHASDQGL